MAKQEQVLVLTPAHELKFRGPFTDVVSSELKLSNPSDRRVLFKVKTTAPKRYCVRPNSGLIEPDSAVSVSVMLQPFDFDQNEKNKHKFMVQTMFAPDGAIDNHDQLWKDATPDALMDSKLKCVFEMAPSDGSQQVKAQSSSQLNASASGDDSIVKTVPAKTVSAAESISSKLTASEPEIRRQVDSGHASDEIKRLIEENNRLKEEGVRLRKVAMSDSITASTPSIPPRSRQMMGEAAQSPLGGLPSIAILLAMIVLGIIIGKFIL